MMRRIEWVDISKGIAIILVIIGHTISLDGVGFKIIYSFHMPFFFLMSGYLYKENKSAVNIIKTGIRRLIIPYIITSISIIIGRIVICISRHYNISEINNIIKRTILGIIVGSGTDYPKGFENVIKIGAIWFLLALFWGLLFFNIIITLTKSCKECTRGIIVIILSTIGFLIGQKIWLPTNIDIGLYCTIYLYIGFLLKKKDTVYKKTDYFIIAIGIVLWGMTIYTNAISMVIRRNSLFIISILGSVTGSYLLIKLSQYISKYSTIKKILCFMGENSLIILCVHLFELEIISWDSIITTFIPEGNLTIIMIQIKIVFVIIATIFLKNYRSIKKFRSLI